MLIIKLNIEGKIKKIRFDEKTQKYEDILKIVEEVTGSSSINITLNFKDFEGDSIEIVDNHDFEYFLGQGETSN